MASILDTVTGAVHDTAQALIDHNIPTKVGDLVSTAVTSGFGIVGDAVKIVADLTAPPPAPGA